MQEIINSQISAKTRFYCTAYLDNVICHQATDKIEFTSANVKTPKILHITFDNILYIPDLKRGDTIVNTTEFLTNLSIDIYHGWLAMAIYLKSSN